MGGYNPGMTDNVERTENKMKQAKLKCIHKPSRKMSGCNSGMAENVENTEKEMKQAKLKRIYKRVGLGVGIGLASVAGAGLLGLAVAPILGAIGFSSGGVVAGSLAAAYQATLGGYIASGSLFALLQSAGVLGISGAAMTGVAAFGGATGGGVALGIHKIFNRSSAAMSSNHKDVLTKKIIEEHFPVLIAMPYVNV